MIEQTKAYLSGTIEGNIKYTARDGYKFSLRTKSGKFFIKAVGLEQIRVVQTLSSGDPVYIVGLLHSFVSKRCRSHHVYVEALVILPVEDTPVFRQLISLLNAEMAN